MKTLILTLIALLLTPLTAEAACTHAQAGAVVTVTCTTGTESTLTTSSTEGLSLESGFFSRPVTGLEVIIETAGTMTAGGVLQAYVQNPLTGEWSRAPDIDLTVAALARQGFVGLSVPAPRGRIVWLPSGVGLASVIYLIPAYR